MIKLLIIYVALTITTLLPIQEYGFSVADLKRWMEATEEFLVPSEWVSVAGWLESV